MRSDSNLMYIAAHHRVHPNAGVLAEHDVPMICADASTKQEGGMVGVIPR